MNDVSSNQQSTQPQVAGQERAFLVPPVDIFEDAGGLTVLADLPGVPKDALVVGVDGDTLTIEGEVRMQFPESMEAEYAEVRVGGFRRSFTLSRELDADRSESTFANGVLRLRIPKTAHAQRRKIEVRSA